MNESVLIGSDSGGIPGRFPSFSTVWVCGADISPCRTGIKLRVKSSTDALL